MAISQLVETIEHSAQLLEQIKELFVVHENALKTRKLDQLESSNEQLASHLLLLKEAFNQRVEIQKQLCPDLNEETWAAYMSELPEQDRNQVNNAWEQLDKVFTDVQQWGQINQQIVRRGQQQIDELVSILQGKGKVNRVYTAQGSSGHVNTQSILGKA